MALTTTANPSSVADRLQTHFSKRLLEVQVDELVLNQEGLGIMEDLPMKIGSRTIRFFKPARASSTLRGASPTLTTDIVGKFAVGGANEGVAISTFRENDFTKVDVSLEQYVQATKISDVLSMIDAYAPLKQNIDLMGRDAALFYDSLTRNALVGSTHPDGSTTPLTHGSDGTNGCELFVNGAGTVVNSGTSATNFANLSALTMAAGKATRALVLTSVTRLKTNKAPKLRGGRYVCLLPPAVQHDLVQDSDYKQAFQNNQDKGVFARELANLDGCRFLEHTNAFTEDEVYGTHDETDDNSDGLIYSTMFLGRGAFGTPKLAGTKSPLAPQVFINDKPDKSDPANQFIVAAWKIFAMSIGLDSLNIVVARSKSTFV